MRATLFPVSTIAERLKEAMDAEGLNQNQLKERLGLKNDGYLSNVFKRNSDGLRPQTLAKLSKALRVRYDWLATGDGPMREAPVDEGPVVELDERYHNRGVAAKAARDFGYPEAAIKSVLSVSLKSDNDLTPDEWLDMMRAEKHRLERLAPDEPGMTDDEHDRAMAALKEQAERETRESEARSKARRAKGPPAPKKT
jgi:transcriptional regulator with XRE-family HTH domain